MKKKMVLLALCCVCVGLASCAAEDVNANTPQTGSVSVTQTEEASKPAEDAMAEQTEVVSAEQDENSSDAPAEEKADENSDAVQTETVSAADNEQTSTPANDTLTDKTDSSLSGQTEDTLPVQTEALAEQNDSISDSLTEEQALEAIRNYCFIKYPNLNDMMEPDGNNIYWTVSTNEVGEIVVLFRSYTSAQIRYYIDPVSGETYVTEYVRAIIDEEQRTDETFNVRDYLG
ncbi:MAG: hypothetical protein IJ806_04965 [Ruminococcus sp.]|nr:hypothetical protein [Ruminococcus sp.]